MPKCDTSKALVTLDATVAVTAGVIGAAVAGESEPAIALLPLSIGALYLAGAVSGNNKVNKCRAAMADFEAYTDARNTAPPPADEAISEAEARRMRPRLDPALPPHTEMIRPPGPAPIAEPVASAPVAPATVPVATAPARVPAATTKPPARPAPVKAPAAKPAPQQADDEWADFWREVE